MPHRRAFTLIELLVVIGIIGLLASIALVAIPMARRQVNNTRCANNLQQIGTGITAYQQEHNGIFPQSLSQMFVTGQVLESGGPGMLLCPWDARKGTSPSFNREALDPSNLTELYDPAHGPDAVPPLQAFAYAPLLPHSYMFEAANVALGAKAQSWWPGQSTWFQAKMSQLRTGHHGGPYAPEQFPIVRCFWHTAWKAYGHNAGNRKVLNLAWGMNVMWTIPEWESDIP